MTTEEKAKAYDEAKEKMREIITMDDNPVRPTEIAKYLFPELKESEDERIRKEIYNFLIGMECKEEWIAYLEKQKELSAKKTPTWMPKFLDELRSKKHYFDWDEHRDIEGSILAIIDFIAPDYFNQKEQFGPDKCKGCNNVKGCINCVDGDQWAHIEEEQKPAEYIKRNSKEWCALLSEQYDKGYWNGKAEQKPVEWSEEEIDKVVIYLHERDGGMLWSKAKEIASDICDILRPQSHWKPGKEQMLALKNIAYGSYQISDGPVLRELYDNLKKL